MLGSVATAGTTGATVMLTLTLSTLGLPLAGVGLLVAVDPILDMGRTAVNVAGQTLVPAIVAKREGIVIDAPAAGTAAAPAAPSSAAAPSSPALPPLPTLPALPPLPALRALPPFPALPAPLKGVPDAPERGS